MSMFDAKASNWALEKFSIEGGSFLLVAPADSYASFSRAFSDGDTVFYAARTTTGTARPAMEFTNPIV